MNILANSNILDVADDNGTLPDGYSVQFYTRPCGDTAEQIVEISRLLTREWFTDNVPDGARKDLFFQDALCVQSGDRIVSFIMFTSLDGEIHINLMGTHPDHRGRGFGSLLVKRLADYAKELGFDRLVAFTVPPDVKPAYESTLRFYKQQGFVIKKQYNELWENGALELVKCLD